MDTNLIDSYRELDLPLDRAATEAEVNRRYRFLAAGFHPDKHMGSSESHRNMANEKLQRINAARDNILAAIKAGVQPDFSRETSGEQSDAERERVYRDAATWGFEQGVAAAREEMLKAEQEPVPEGRHWFCFAGVLVFVFIPIHLAVKASRPAYNWLEFPNWPTALQGVVLVFFMLTCLVFYFFGRREDLAVKRVRLLRLLFGVIVVCVLSLVAIYRFPTHKTEQTKKPAVSAQTGKRYMQAKHKQKDASIAEGLKPFFNAPTGHIEADAEGDFMSTGKSRALNNQAQEKSKHFNGSKINREVDEPIIGADAPDIANRRY